MARLKLESGHLQIIMEAKSVCSKFADYGDVSMLKYQLNCSKLMQE